MMNRFRVVVQIEMPTMRRACPNREVGSTTSLPIYWARISAMNSIIFSNISSNFTFHQKDLKSFSIN
jgi:hypothetical protein